jgi:hypothetical protein
MTLTRIALRIGIVVIVGFMLLVAIGIHGALTPVIALLALGGLIACGNLLYGKNSHGATAKARVRPAQEAQNRAIDEAQQRARQERELLRRQRTEARRQPGQPGQPGQRRQGGLQQTQRSGDDPG